MTIAQRAVANALHCEAKKHAYRQTQDGVVVSFVLHPQEVPESLAIAALGTRYMLALVAIGDDEQPLAELKPTGPRPQEGFVGDDIAHDLAEIPLSGGKCSKGTGASGAEGSIPSRSTKSWDELKPSQQAGILCGEPKFWTFIQERGAIGIKSAADAATWVRMYCDVNSRASITPQRPLAMSRWRELVVDYRLWERAAV